MPKHRIRVLIDNKYTRTAANHIGRGDLTGYTTDGNFIYKELTDEQYAEAVRTGKNEPFIMDELGIEATYDFNYKP